MNELTPRELRLKPGMTMDEIDFFYSAQNQEEDL